MDREASMLGTRKGGHKNPTKPVAIQVAALLLAVLPLPESESLVSLTTLLVADTDGARDKEGTK